MAQTQNFTWAQGADLRVQLRYKEGDTVETAVIVPLSTGYAVRMDIVVPSTRERLYTFNSADIADVDGGTAGAQPDTNKEGTLSDGAGGTPNIDIIVPRSLTLQGGPVYAKLTGTPPITMFAYDIFLRNTSTDTQSKILSGSINVETSYTLWQ